MNGKQREKKIVRLLMLCALILFRSSLVGVPRSPAR